MTSDPEITDEHRLRRAQAHREAAATHEEAAVVHEHLADEFDGSRRFFVRLSSVSLP